MIILCPIKIGVIEAPLSGCIIAVPRDNSNYYRNLSLPANMPGSFMHDIPWLLRKRIES